MTLSAEETHKLFEKIGGMDQKLDDIRDDLKTLPCKGGNLPCIQAAPAEPQSVKKPVLAAGGVGAMMIGVWEAARHIFGGS